MNDALSGPDRQIGRYRLERLLGEGAAGLVYEATRDDGLEVALKLLRPERADERTARARFVREARLAAQLGRGLDALHEAGILHRDVKPSNVLLGRDGTIALSDFGLARAADSTRLTQDGQMLGTPHYLAPELIEGEEATPASDVYALGCVLYECVAGEPPFAGRRAAEVGFAHLTEPPPDVRERRPEVSPDFSLALVTGLQKDPASRPTSGTALARMLHVAHTASPA